MLRLLRLAPLALILVFSAAQAEDEVLGTFERWDAVATTEGKTKLCYVASLPEKEEGDYERRGEVSVLIAHWPAQKRFNVVTVNAGYPYKDDSTVSAQIGGASFRLYPKGESAWTESAAADRRLVAAMKGGATMIVTGVSSRGTETKDTYSLSGVTAALGAIDKACGVN